MCSIRKSIHFSLRYIILYWFYVENDLPSCLDGVRRTILTPAGEKSNTTGKLKRRTNPICNIRTESDLRASSPDGRAVYGKIRLRVPIVLFRFVFFSRLPTTTIRQYQLFPRLYSGQKRRFRTNENRS